MTDAGHQLSPPDGKPLRLTVSQWTHDPQHHDITGLQSEQVSLGQFNPITACTFERRDSLFEVRRFLEGSQVLAHTLM